MQAAAKPDKAKERLRTMSGTMKRTVSWNELHPQKEPAARREPSGGMAKQPSLPASKRLLHKLTHAPSGSAKVQYFVPSTPQSPYLGRTSSLWWRFGKVENPCILWRIRDVVQVPIKLPVLTPMEIKILASVGERAWIKIDTKASHAMHYFGDLAMQ